MKHLGIDYGEKRIGLAISDDDGRQALPKTTIVGMSQSEVLKLLRDFVVEEHIEKIIVGLPVGLSGEETGQTEEVRRFVEKLRNHVEVPVQTFDERMTSEMAKGMLKGADSAKEDQVAAQIFLQDFLDQQNR